jgi:hypothetical protein
MKTFLLKNRTNETIAIVRVDSKEEAIEYFSKLKNLSSKELLKIYKVVEDENRGVSR